MALDTREPQKIETSVTAPAGADRDAFAPWPRALPWCGLVVGTALLVQAYAVAERGTSDAVFVWFWAGMLAFLLPVGARLASSRASRSERYALLTAFGLFTYVPKLLRNPSGPRFFDELAHWVQSERLIATGDVFDSNATVKLAETFPGLHGVTAMLHDLTGLSTWRVGVLLVATFHVVGLLGVFVLARRASGSDRVAAVAALVYGVNPGYLLFTSQYAYESIAIVFVIWSLAAASEAAARRPSLTRTAWVAIAALLAVACTFTHHLSSIVLAIGLLVVAIAAERRHRFYEIEGSARDLWILLVGVVAVDLAWFAFVAREAGQYLYDLSPLPQVGWENLRRLFTGEAGRGTFGDSGLPALERLAAFAAPVLAIAAGALGWRSVRTRWTVRAALTLACTFATLYVLSLPLILTRSGHEGARRSWPFDYLGVAILVGLGALVAVRLGAARSSAQRRMIATGLLTGLAVLAIGNVAADSNRYARFPGTWVAGSDSRHLTAELQHITAWFRETQGDDRRVIADLYTKSAFAALGRARTPSGLPTWRLYFPDRIDDDALVRELDRRGYEYVVVDRRLATALPRVGYWFAREEPEAGERERPVSLHALTKLERLPWATKILATEHFDVYRVDLGQAREDT